MDRQPQSPAATRRRWYQFSLRALAIAVVVVSVVLGWFTARLRRAQRQAAAVAAVRRNFVSVRYDFECKRDSAGTLADVPNASSRVPQWLLHWLGPDFFHDVVSIDWIITEVSQAKVDETIAAIGECRNLELLTVNGHMAGVRPNLAPLQRLHKLRALLLDLPPLSPADLEMVAEKKNLEYLSCRLQRMDAKAARQLATLSNLRSLRLSQSRIEDSAVHELAALRNLETLALDETTITDSGMEAIGTMRSLRRLHLEDTQVTDRGARVFGQLKKLEELHLRMTQITGEGVELPVSLTRLDLTGTPFTDVGLRNVARCLALQEFDLAGTRVSDVGLTRLAPLSRLESLDLSRTDTADESLQVIGRLPSLERLSLDHTKVTDRGLVHLQGASALRAISLDDTAVSTKGIRWPATLEIISLCQTRITDDALMDLAQCQNLRWAYVKNADSPLTDAGIASFQAARPDVMTDSW